MNQPAPVAAPSSAEWSVLATLSLLTFGNYYAYDAAAFVFPGVDVRRPGTMANNCFSRRQFFADTGIFVALRRQAREEAPAFVFAIALWRRETGPHGHGLEIPR